MTPNLDFFISHIITYGCIFGNYFKFSFGILKILKILKKSVDKI